MDNMPALKLKLIALEQRLLEPQVRASAAQLSELIAPDFIEVGASGHRFGLDEVLTRLPQEQPPQFKNSDFELRLLSDNIAQLCYKASIIYSESDTRHSRRTSIWRLNEEQKWQMIYHQGTSC